MAKLARTAAPAPAPRGGFAYVPVLGMVAIFIVAVGLFFALQASPNGASAEEVPDLASASVQSMLDRLSASADSSAYLIQNSTTVIPQLVNELNALSTQLNSGGAVPGDKGKAQDLIKKMLGELQAVQANVASNRTAAQQSADAFMADKAALDAALRVSSPLAGTSSNGVPVLKQNDGSPDTLLSYGDGKTIKTSGCAVVSAAMVLQYYKKDVTIKTIRDYSLEHGFRKVGQGTDHAMFPSLASAYGLKYTDLTGNWDGIMGALRSHQPVIVSGKSATKNDPPFTTSGHFVVLTGINSDGTISVNDPYHANRSYSPEKIRSQMHYAALIAQQ